MNINEIKELKNQYQAAIQKCHQAKTKKTSEKYRDLAQSIRRQISNELAEWNFDNLDFKQLNIMAPVGGPYHTLEASDFKVESNLGSCLQISFEYNGTRYAGYVHWIDNKCGFDNLKNIA